MGELLNSMEWYYMAIEKEIKPKLSFRGRTKSEFKAWHSRLKAKLLELLGKFPPRVSLNPDKIGQEDCGKFIREKYTIAVEKNLKEK